MAHLLDNLIGFPKIIHVQRTYNWEFILPSFGLIVDGYIVSKYCQSVKFGQYDIGEILEMKSGVRKQFFPGVMNIQTVSATFITPVPDLVAAYFSNWKSKIIDDEGYYSPSSWYKKTIYVLLYDRTGIPCNMILLKGAFPIKFPAYNLSYGEENVVRYDVEFRVDRIKIGVSELTSIIGGAGSMVKGLGSAAMGAVGSIASGVKSTASKLGKAAASLGGK